MKTSEVTRISIGPWLTPSTPAPDDQAEASAVLNEVLQCSLEFTNKLRAIVNEHFDATPASSEHASGLTGVLSTVILDWIERWPA